MSFFDELKRRKVFRVAATYAVVAWILMQIGEVTFPALNIPEWVMSTLVVVLLSGFPIAVIFAWIFDKTPQGYIKTDALETEHIGGMNVKVDKRAFYLQKRNIVLVLGLLVGVLIGTYGGSGISINSKDDKSIAVLPFDNFSKDKDDGYLSDGITEDITMNLAKVKELTVISRTSVMKYKSSMMNAKEIAEELSVKYILEGSIRRIGERVRIVGQLIDAENDKHIWSDSYDRDMADIFDIQADVSKEIANAMEAELTDKTLIQLETIPTNNMDAYILYQRARSYYGMYTRDGNEISINLLNEALGIDKNYALAYAGLADCYGQRVIRFNYGEEWIDSALHVADLALKINPNLAEAYKAKGLIHMASHKLTEGERATDKALSLNPGYHTAVANKGVFLSRRGQLFEAQKFLNKSTRLSPTSTATENAWLNNIYFMIDEIEIADNFLFSAIKNSPNVRSTYKNGILRSLRVKDNQKALKIIETFKKNIGEEDYTNFFNGLYNYYNKSYEKALEYFVLSKSVARNFSSGGTTGFMNANYLLQTLHHLNKPYDKLLAQGLSILESNFNNGADSYTSHVQLSAFYLLIEDEERALDELEKAVRSGLRDYSLLKDISFDLIRNNDRFKLISSEIDIFIQKEKLKFKEAGLIPST
jgi:TolB-like protein/Tfp pilus assembly protein PilF